MDWESMVKQICLLINRLERLSSDSIWAHRASGIRGSLLGYLDDLKHRYPLNTNGSLDLVLDQGYYVLEQAAKISLTKNRIKLVDPTITNYFGERSLENDISPE